MDDFFNPTETSDPSSDFLKREQEALGNTFGEESSSNQLHSNTTYDKDFSTSASAFPDLNDNNNDNEDELNSFVSAPQPIRNNNLSVTNNHEEDEFESFENQYPEVELTTSNLPVQQQASFGGSVPNGTYTQPASLFQGTPQPIEEESEFIKSWKIKQAEEISIREIESSKKKEETIVKAQNAIDNFYKEYNSKKEKNIALNKEEEAAFNTKRTDALAQGTTWERICTTVELEDSRSKTTTQSKKDLTRFKEILLALKREGETAPGAGGY